MGRTSGAVKETLFMGIDSSTQSLQAMLVDRDQNIVSSDSVNFDRDLPEFGTRGGVHRQADGVTVTSPALMWVAALDLLLDRMRAAGRPLERVAAVSGSGQQHGSVWLNRSAPAVLAGLDAANPLREQAAGMFSLADSPVWMDFSTTAQCRARERAMGGAQAVADVTGSRAYERFTGNQIAKIQQAAPATYDRTEHVALVSSFMASLFAGQLVPIDVSDGSGMNLMDIRGRRWAPEALSCTAPDLARRLGDPVPSHTVFGPLHPYYRKRYGFSDACRVVVFSGDNPCSLAGLMLQHDGDVAISLGTSDTMFGSLADPHPSGAEGHIFANPIDPSAYMAMLCRKNGSLTREYVRDAVAGGSWADFNRLLDETVPGNEGCLGFYFKEPEITPPVLSPGIFRFDGTGRAVDQFSPGAEVRAVVEGQFLAMRSHGAAIGLKPRRLLATGGASANRHILTVVANVFGVPVCTGESTGSAALGAAYRAMHGWACGQAGRFLPFEEVLVKRPEPAMIVEPDAAAHGRYSGMLDCYRELERRVCGGDSDQSRS